ncbi:MAG: DUF5723 family protein [Bacteroidetes bacterium]|nr:DUF5723 family protein [Bacteroidota bacterium]
MKIRIYILFAFFATLLSMQENATAQDGNTIYFMNSIPQSNYLNPASLPNCNFYLGFPGLSAVGASFEIGNFTYNNMFTRRADDSLIIDKDKLLSSMSDNNKISTDFTEQLFAMGFKIKRNYFSFSVTNKFSTNFNYTKALMTLLLKGNEEYIGKTANLSDSKISLNDYMEFAFGYSREISKKLTLGVRFKYLIGIVNVYTERSNLYLYTDPTTYALTASSDFLIHSSSPFDSLTNIGDQIKNLKTSNLMDNKGIAFDFGGEYRLNDKFTFGLSVVDLGSITWKSNVKDYVSKKPNTPFLFNGFDINEIFPASGFNSAVMKDIEDSLKETFGITDRKGTSYSAPLKTKLYSSIAFALTPNNRFGLLMRNDFVNNDVNTMVSVSYNRSIGKFFAFTVSNTFVSGNVFNPGAGFNLNIGPFQFYLIGDHFSSLYLADMKNFGMQFGINLFVLGRNTQGNRYVTKKAVVVEDETPSVRRLKQLRKDAGKDADSDGVINKNDKCPDTPPGVQVDSLGCPLDTDGDSIADYLDKCPNTPKGIKVDTNGCPVDTDGDGVPDFLDKCPTVKGLIIFQGCPDTDGDSVQDAEDRCPNEKGEIALQGCPDKDKDGTPDIDDKCPEVAGPKENHGCPVEVKAEVKELFKKALQGIQFASGKEVILKPSFGILDQVAKVMKDNPIYILTINGHTDNVGNPEKNKELSEKRANAVKKYLQQKGVEENRMKAKGFGDTLPVADNKTKEGQKQNRRVEFIVEF